MDQAEEAQAGEEKDWVVVVDRAPDEAQQEQHEPEDRDQPGAAKLEAERAKSQEEGPVADRTAELCSLPMGVCRARAVEEEVACGEGLVPLVDVGPEAPSGEVQRCVGAQVDQAQGRESQHQGDGQE